MSTNMRRRGLTASSTSASSGSVVTMKLPIGSTRRRSSGRSPSAYALVATITSWRGDRTTGGRDPEAAGGLLEPGRGAVVVHPGARRASEPGQAGVEAGRVQPTGPGVAHRAVELGRADLVRQLLAVDEDHVLPFRRVLLGQLAQVLDLTGGVREVQLPGPCVVAVDLDRR